MVIDGSLKCSINIKNSECMVTNKIVIISNSELAKNEEIAIEIGEILSVKIGVGITFNMNGNYMIYINA